MWRKWKKGSRCLSYWPATTLTGACESRNFARLWSFSIHTALPRYNKSVDAVVTRCDSNPCGTVQIGVTECGTHSCMPKCGESNDLENELEIVTVLWPFTYDTVSTTVEADGEGGCHAALLKVSHAWKVACDTWSSSGVHCGRRSLSSVREGGRT
ncbi:hypothetical protein PYCCODRAFT_707339 [Trametes coccinea BRFM310]|uniref:Uncharacterized protein n=1 Tax=Trametes coccinea (strain BRFM310) TaxID=1353009 RepID=A0A1Y2IIW7_TRAC3|nr:hypothetical protein PYCCODRAFT_707339 [Trametes coccinea BRFM310]